MCPPGADIFHALVAEWFGRCFGRPTEPQARAWPALAAGRDVLVSAPTGSGKTLAAFLVCIDRLVRAALSGALGDCVEVVYVSPLKALSNDIQRNLDWPLSGIAALAADHALLLPPIRTAVRTGDTTSLERQRMIRRPPHILVTTPESLFILLTAERGRAALATARTVIVDEIHAVVDDKRGAHLALSLARLDHLVERSGRPAPQRIGLSATVTPIDAVAHFLSGTGQAEGERRQAGGGGRGERVRDDRRPAGHRARAIEIVDTGHRREMDLAIEVPRDELGPVASNEMWAEIYDRLADLVRAHRTTLVFVNTRRLAERVAHHLGERLGERAVLAHHGSLSRRLRLTAEERLRRGDLQAIVATASLELGIDIGSVDLVCQIGSPRSIGVALQRIGRSGHRADPSSLPKGRVFVTTRDELVESAALVRAIRSGALDRLEMPAWPRDVLAQQVVAAAANEPWREDDLFHLVRGAWPYRDLPRHEFDAIIDVLSDGISTRRSRAAGAFLHRDRVNGIIRGRRGARLAAITCGGAIPDNANYLVVAEPDATIVGSVDEDFAVESLAGDVFLLGTNSWRIRRVEAGRVRVEDAHGAPPSIPFWRGEAPGRTVELSAEVARVREDVAGAASVEAAHDVLIRQCGCDPAGARQAAEYIRSGVAALGAVPTDRVVVAERFFDEGGGMQLVVHAPFGARINRAWGLALRKRFCRSFNFELQAAATDDGIVISLGEQHSFPLEAVFRFLGLETVEHLLTQAMLPAPMFTARWRWNASRALAVLRFAGGRKVPAPIQRMRSDDLLAAVFPDQAACPENLSGDIRIPDHPLVNETIRDCLHEAMDLEGLKRVLASIRSGDIRTVAIDTPEPSVFSHEILNANPYAYLDDAPLEERRARAVQMRRTLGPEGGETGALDAAAIAAVAAEAWPGVGNTEELHDALLTLVVLPVARARAEWQPWFDDLAGQRRATTLRSGDRMLWVAAERADIARAAYPHGEFAQQIGVAIEGPTVRRPEGPKVGIREGPEVRWSEDSDVARSDIGCHESSVALGFSRAIQTNGLPGPSQEDAVTEVLRGWLGSTGPATASQLADRLALPRETVETALVALESEGQILRGTFTPHRSQGATSGERPGLPALADGVEGTAERDGGSRGVDAKGDTTEGGRPEAAGGTPEGTRREAEGANGSGSPREIEWCNRRLLARIHRLTIGRLRREIEPVTAADFLRFLFRWQHVAPGTQLHGVEGTLQVLEQLEGYEVVASAWESTVLRGRVSAYAPDLLDRLCLSGEVMWGRLSPHRALEAGDAAAGRRLRPTRAAPIAIFRREDAPWLLPRRDSHRPPSVLSPAASDVLDALDRNGASFLSELTTATGHDAREVEDALWELAAAGLVTADGFDNLRRLLHPRGSGDEHDRFRYLRASARIGGYAGVRSRHAAGRWALLRAAAGADERTDDSATAEAPQRASPVGDPGDDRRVEGFARVLLLRWGVVFRDLLAREVVAPPWRDLLVVLRRMEARGAVRGGRFVSGFAGEQFARPDALDGLRAIRQMKDAPRPLRVAAADPLNLAGILVPGPRISPLSGDVVEVLPAAEGQDVTAVPA